jgi:hypothetical protein
VPPTFGGPEAATVTSVLSFDVEAEPPWSLFFEPQATATSDSTITTTTRA